MKKKFLICTSAVLMLFLGFNIIWAAITLSKYKPYKEAVGYDDLRERWYYRDDNYVYSVSPPSYLSFTGNLAITEVVKINTEGNVKKDNTCNIIIWPKLDGSFEFGISIGVKNNDNKSYTNYEYMMDEKMQPLDELTDNEQQIFDENIDKIVTLYQLAKKMWSELPITEE